ncbi:MAG: hypothetical protein IIC23_12250 [Chloroflexi bacterium]|nr:hypothetical protein [Chloroflexota bacterium]
MWKLYVSLVNANVITRVPMWPILVEELNPSIPLSERRITFGRTFDVAKAANEAQEMFDAISAISEAQYGPHETKADAG